MFDGIFRHLLLCLLARFAVPIIGMDKHAVFGKCLFERECLHRVMGMLHVRFGDDLTDRQVEFLGKFEIAFVVGWHAHDGSGAVFHHHVIADPYRQLLAAERIYYLQAGVDAVLFDLGLAVSRFQIFGDDRVDLCDHLD